MNVFKKFDQAFFPIDLPLRSESTLSEKPSSEPSLIICFNRSNSNMNSDASYLCSYQIYQTRWYH